jgi:hypothetical protein
MAKIILLANLRAVTCMVSLKYLMANFMHSAGKDRPMVCPCVYLDLFFANKFKANDLKKTPWSESASELYRLSDRRLSAKLLPSCADRGCHVVSVTDPSGRILSVF